ncbi:hypothetical protein LCGC14_2766570, partial [marine sediment metagenome]
MANIDKSDMSLKETHSLFGELARQTRLYLKLEEGVGIALQAENDKASLLKELKTLRANRDKVKIESEKHVVEIKTEIRKVEAELNDVKAVGEVHRKQGLEVAAKDNKFLTDKAGAIRREVDGLVKQRDDIFAELPVVRTEVDAEIGEYRTLAEREKKRIDNELSDSQSKLKAFKT